MKKLVFILSICLWSFWAVAGDNPVSEVHDDTEYNEHLKESVKKFKDILKTDNPELIAKNVVYPYSLGWGVPSIHNEQEFIEKYNIILPEYLRKYLIDSPDSQWDSGQNLGGICLNYCPDAHLTYDGEMRSVKDSEELKKYREEYIAKEKQIIHPILKEYNYNLYTMETEDWLVRIDDMEGLYEAYSEYERQKHYRLSLWKKGKTISDEPDIVIEHGYLWLPEEKNADYIYDFSNEEYFCRFIVHSIGPIDYPPYYIALYKMQFSEYPKVYE